MRWALTWRDLIRHGPFLDDAMARGGPTSGQLCSWDGRDWLQVAGPRFRFKLSLDDVAR